MTALATSGFSTVGLAAEALDNEPDWFALEDQIEAVSDGELRFLTTPPPRPVHRHQNQIHISADSITTGWVALSQCHHNLDAVAEAQIVFQPGRVRALEILSYHNIAKAYVEGTSIQLQGVKPSARLCLSALTRALRHTGDGRLLLRNGPFMRRFLDGFYPLTIDLKVRWPADQLRLQQVNPQAQPGLRISRDDASLHLRGTFEGILYTELHLCDLSTDACHTSFDAKPHRP